MQEQRKLSRLITKRKVKVLLNGAHAYVSGYLIDLNLKGGQLALPIKLPVDTFLKMSLVLCDDFVLDIEVWIVWNSLRHGLNVYGLYFSRIKDEDKEKIYKLLLRDYSSQLNQRWWGANRKGGHEMKIEAYNDKRTFARFPVQFSARLLSAQLDKEVLAQVRDISAKGVGLAAKVRLPARTALELWLDIPDDAEPLYSRGEVAWCGEGAADEYRMGVSLEKADFMGLARVLRVKQ